MYHFSQRHLRYSHWYTNSKKFIKNEQSLAIDVQSSLFLVFIMQLILYII